MTLSTTIGHCCRIESAVTEETCLECFTAQDFDGDARRTQYGLRTHCISANVVNAAGPHRLLIGQDLDALPKTRLRHIMGNAVMVAQAYPYERTARTLLREIRLHLGGVSVPAALDPGKEE